MGNAIFYKNYIKRKWQEINKLSYESKKYARSCSIVNRLTDWELKDSE